MCVESQIASIHTQALSQIKNNLYLAITFPREEESKFINFEKAAGFKDKRILWNRRVVLIPHGSFRHIMFYVKCRNRAIFYVHTLCPPIRLRSSSSLYFVVNRTHISLNVKGT